MIQLWDEDGWTQVVSEDDGSGSGTTHVVTEEVAASGMEDATATVGVGASLNATAFTAPAVEDGTSGRQIINAHCDSWMSFHSAVTAVVDQSLT